MNGRRRRGCGTKSKVLSRNNMPKWSINESNSWCGVMGASWESCFWMRRQDYLGHNLRMFLYHLWILLVMTFSTLSCKNLSNFVVCWFDWRSGFVHAICEIACNSSNYEREFPLIQWRQIEAVYEHATYERSWIESVHLGVWQYGCVENEQTTTVWSCIPCQGNSEQGRLMIWNDDWGCNCGWLAQIEATGVWRPSFPGTIEAG